MRTRKKQEASDRRSSLLERFTHSQNAREMTEAWREIKLFGKKEHLSPTERETLLRVKRKLRIALLIAFIRLLMVGACGVITLGGSAFFIRESRENSLQDEMDTFLNIALEEMKKPDSKKNPAATASFALRKAADAYIAKLYAVPLKKPEDEELGDLRGEKMTEFAKLLLRQKDPELAPFEPYLRLFVLPSSLLKTP